MLSADNLRSIEGEGRLLGSMARAEPQTPVPQYPGWSLEDLAYHTAATHGRTELIIRQLATERVHSPRCPEGMSVFEWYDQTLDRMLTALSETDPGLAVWGFGPSPTVGFWERRMVIETGVHRWDGSQACREKTSLTDHVAEAGLDEFGPMWLQYLGEVGPMTMRATDLDRTWSYGTGGGDIVEGTASDLYLRLMSRPSPVELPSAWATAVDGLTPPPKPDRSPRPT